MYSDYVHLYDLKASGVHGGTATAGSWETRDLTNEVEDDGNLCSLAANQFTLQPGTYKCLVSAPGFRCRSHQIRLYNITDAISELIGTTAWTSGNSSNASTRSYMVGRFTIASPKVFEIQHRVTTTRATNGHGNAQSWGEDNFYTNVELWKET